MSQIGPHVAHCPPGLYLPHLIQNGIMRIEMAHLLVVIGHRDVASQTQCPLVWGVLTHEQPQERAFASPIRPHETHFLATVDRTGEAAQHWAVAIGLPDLAANDHLMAL